MNKKKVRRESKKRRKNLSQSQHSSSREKWIVFFCRSFIFSIVYTSENFNDKYENKIYNYSSKSSRSLFVCICPLKSIENRLGIIYLILARLVDGIFRRFCFVAGNCENESTCFISYLFCFRFYLCAVNGKKKTKTPKTSKQHRITCQTC